MGIASQSLKILGSVTKYALITIVLVIVISPAACMFGMHPRVGWFPESNFYLSPESRFPEWFSIPAGLTRDQVAVKIYYFMPPFGEEDFKTELIQLHPRERVLERKYGASRWHPVTLKKMESGEDHYPSFHIANVGEVLELVEHRWRGPTFFVSDDNGMKQSANMGVEK